MFVLSFDRNSQSGVQNSLKLLYWHYMLEVVKKRRKKVNGIACRKKMVIFLPAVSWLKRMQMLLVGYIDSIEKARRQLLPLEFIALYLSHYDVEITSATTSSLIGEFFFRILRKSQFFNESLSLFL